MKFFTQYDRPDKKDFLIVIDPVEDRVEDKSYIPIDEQINALMVQGQSLEDARKKLAFDFQQGEKIDDRPGLQEIAAMDHIDAQNHLLSSNDKIQDLAEKTKRSEKEPENPEPAEPVKEKKPGE